MWAWFLCFLGIIEAKGGVHLVVVAVAEAAVVVGEEVGEEVSCIIVPCLDLGLSMFGISECIHTYPHIYKPMYIGMVCVYGCKQIYLVGPRIM
jgi:hypothetical protein